VPRPKEDPSNTAGSSTTPSTFPDVSWDQVYFEFAFSSSGAMLGKSLTGHSPLFLLDDFETDNPEGESRPVAIDKPWELRRVPLAPRDVNVSVSVEPLTKGHCSRQGGLESYQTKPLVAGQWSDVYSRSDSVSEEYRWEPRASQAHFPEEEV